MSALNPKTVVITGASRGFGKLATQELLRRGHRVVAVMRGGEKRAREIFGSFPNLFAADLNLDRPGTLDSEIRGLKTLIRDQLQGRVDALVNNAGYGLMGAVESFTEAELRAQMEVNFFSPVRLMQELLPELRTARDSRDSRDSRNSMSASRPKIINVSSLAGRMAFPFYGAYNASKFSLEAISEALAADLAPEGIDVALIEPGGFKTEFSTRTLFGSRTSTDPDAQRRIIRRQEKFQASVQEKTQKVSGDPTHVAQLLVSLIEKKGPLKLRYPIGRDAHLILCLGRILPDQWRFRIIGWVFQRRVFFDLKRPTD